MLLNFVQPYASLQIEDEDFSAILAVGEAYNAELGYKAIVPNLDDKLAEFVSNFFFIYNYTFDSWMGEYVFRAEDALVFSSFYLAWMNASQEVKEKIDQGMQLLFNIDALVEVDLDGTADLDDLKLCGVQLISPKE